MSNHHIVSKKTYIGTFTCLLFLTFITVVASRVDLGGLNTPISLGIAILKATIVALFFMGLFWDKGINAIFVIGAVLCVLIFVAFTFSDFAFRGTISKEEAQIFGIQSPVKPLKSGVKHHE